MTELRIGVIGAGGKAVDYAASWIKMPGLRFAAVADVSEASRNRLLAVVQAAGHPAPRVFADHRQMLAECRADLDVVYISTPHAMHGAQAVDVTEAGLDLFVEKPMVTTVTEARALIEAQKRAGNLIVVAFNGGLSPLVRDTRGSTRASSARWSAWRAASGRVGPRPITAAGSKTRRSVAAASCSTPGPI